MIALWTLNEWTRLGSPKPLQLVELGPGKGSMMHDILRVSELIFKTLGFLNITLLFLFCNL